MYNLKPCKACKGEIWHGIEERWKDLVLERVRWSIHIAPLQGLLLLSLLDVGLEAAPIVTTTSRQGAASSPQADVLRPFRAEWNNQRSSRKHLPIQSAATDLF
jgi:hypothetical protein